MERIRPNSQILVRESRQTVNEEYQAQISRWIAAKVRKLVLEMIKGSVEYQYKRIWEYCAKIKKTHDGSTMEVMFTPFRELGGNPKFMRIYCCLGSMKKGFKDDCRPIIGLDGCHLKGTYKRQLLTAIATDPNNGWWPIALGDIEREATGLDRASAEVLPNCEHRYCVQHMYQNFKKKHTGLPLKNRLWNIANCITEELYNKAMAELKDFDNWTYQWMKNAPAPQHWCKAFFPSHTKSDMLVKGPRGAQFAVDMEKRNCTCRLWEISGIPCCHAIAAILLKNEDPREYLNVCYSRGLFLNLYRNVLQPISGEDHWPPINNA
ncbi:uncharacterized protein [Coffea arabica]|uniref:SWIM-type domain-containing protein n=1 Tax=Coffea arabica TaxID=13443 RepID=A0ABM4UFM0_COFAR